MINSEGSVKQEYQNGEFEAWKPWSHSFEILEKIDPQKVINRSPWAKHFIDELKNRV